MKVYKVDVGQYTEAVRANEFFITEGGSLVFMDALKVPFRAWADGHWRSVKEYHEEDVS